MRASPPQLRRAKDVKNYFSFYLLETQQIAPFELSTISTAGDITTAIFLVWIFTAMLLATFCLKIIVIQAFAPSDKVLATSLIFSLKSRAVIS
jgi:hypothetical protein